MQNLILKEGLLGLAVLVGAVGVTQLNTLQQAEGIGLVIISALLFVLRGIGKKYGWF